MKKRCPDCMREMTCIQSPPLQEVWDCSYCGTTWEKVEEKD